MIDISEMLISDLGLRKPETYREAIFLLGEEGIIPGEFAYRFSPIAGLRNILVHDYIKVDICEIYRHLQEDLKDFDQCARYITEYLK